MALRSVSGNDDNNNNKADDNTKDIMQHQVLFLKKCSVYKEKKNSLKVIDALSRQNTIKNNCVIMTVKIKTLTV